MTPSRFNNRLIATPKGKRSHTSMHFVCATASKVCHETCIP